MSFNFICFLVVCTAAGALAQEEGFFCKAGNEILAFGEIYIKVPVGYCQAVICGHNGELEDATCELPVPRPGCTFVPGDTTKQYPDCCDRYVC